MSEPLLARPKPLALLPDHVWLAGVRHRVETVKLDDLAAWKDRHGLQYSEDAWCGRMGWVKVYEREQ